MSKKQKPKIVYESINYLDCIFYTFSNTKGLPIVTVCLYMGLVPLSNPESRGVSICSVKNWDLKMGSTIARTRAIKAFNWIKLGKRYDLKPIHRTEAYKVLATLAVKSFPFLYKAEHISPSKLTPFERILVKNWNNTSDKIVW